jgi:sec-independent protein translocase protein TatB
VFGLSFGEFLVLLLVAVVVLGPKDLPRYLRKAGQFAGRLRRLAFDMREKSGIDEVLRTEGIDQDIAEIRRLARGEIVGVVAAVRSVADPLRSAADAVRPGETRPLLPASAPSVTATPPPQPEAPPPVFVSEREYPAEGADSYGALPPRAKVYEGSLAPSPLADDPLYAQGEDGPRGEHARSSDPPHAAAASPEGHP